MTEDFELTAREKNLILILREKEDKERRQREYSLKVLRLTTQYEEWLQERNMSGTFSEFVKFYGDDNDDAVALYRHIENVRHAVRTIHRQ